MIFDLYLSCSLFGLPLEVVKAGVTTTPDHLTTPKPYTSRSFCLGAVAVAV